MAATLTFLLSYRDRPGDQREQSVRYEREQVACSHLLNDSAAEGHVGAAEDIRHVPRHFQVILAIHTWDLKGKGDYVRRVTTCLPSPLRHQGKVAYPPKQFLLQPMGKPAKSLFKKKFKKTP